MCQHRQAHFISIEVSQEFAESIRLQRLCEARVPLKLRGAGKWLLYGAMWLLQIPSSVNHCHPFLVPCDLFHNPRINRIDPAESNRYKIDVYYRI